MSTSVFLRALVNGTNDFPKDPSGEFQAKRIIHARLCINTSGGPAFPIQFYTQRVKGDIKDISKLESYVRDLTMAGGQAATTDWDQYDGYDITVEDQCWIIFELDRTVKNWRFFDQGISSKDDPTGWDFGLRYAVDGEGALSTGPIPAGAPCRVMVLGVERRRPAPDHHRYVNFHVEFTQGIRTLKLIFDPDIPNNGGDDIPP